MGSAQATTRLSLIRYREGATNYLDVVTAQTAELQAEQTLLSLQTRPPAGGREPGPRARRRLEHKRPAVAWPGGGRNTVWRSGRIRRRQHALKAAD